MAGSQGNLLHHGNYFFFNVELAAGKREGHGQSASTQPNGPVKGTTLKELAKAKIEDGEQNRTMLGDPVSLKAETSKQQPVDHDNGPRGIGSHQEQDAEARAAGKDSKL
jgi:hypothetical protein